MPPFSIVIFVLLFISLTSSVPVNGFAIDFVTGDAFEGGEIQVFYGNGSKATHIPTQKTDKNGHFMFDLVPNHQYFFTIKKFFFHLTQSNTYLIPPSGLPADKIHSVALQVPSDLVYDAIEVAVPSRIKLDKSKCQMVVTVAKKGITMFDGNQGYKGAQITVTPSYPGMPQVFFYFGQIDGKTDPLARGLTSCSGDGGVVIPNVPPGEYIVHAHDPKDPSVKFSSTTMRCVKNNFVNAPPPVGPAQLN